MSEYDTHAFYIQRCFDLARQGAQTASPNPMVGCVIVHDNRIIGEGFHVVHGQAHAEVNAVNSVNDIDKHLLPESTLYVSLEPCCHFGLTPPCTDMILRERIPKVVISVQDPSPRVAGNGIKKLREAGVQVTTGILEAQGLELLQHFLIPVSLHRPFVLVKFVQSSDLFIGRDDVQVWLSNAYEKIMVHKMRSEVDAIMVATNTAVVDDPQLTTRNYTGRNPIRVVLDRTLRIPGGHRLFDGTTPTIVYTESDDRPRYPNTTFVHVSFDETLLPSILDDLYNRDIRSLMVEGGSSLIRSFDELNLWDEACVVTTSDVLYTGVKAPILHGKLKSKFTLDEDYIVIMSNPAAST